MEHIARLLNNTPFCINGGERVKASNELKLAHLSNLNGVKYCNKYSYECFEWNYVVISKS